MKGGRPRGYAGVLYDRVLPVRGIDRDADMSITPNVSRLAKLCGARCAARGALFSDFSFIAVNFVISCPGVVHADFAPA